MKAFQLKNIFAVILLFVSPLTFSQSHGECPLYFSEANVCAEFKWVEGPYLNEGHHRRGHRGHHSMNMKKYSTLDILFYEKGDRSFTPMNFPFVKVYPWMIMHGMEHGSRPVKIKQLSNGVYRVSQILFMKMHHGYWEMRFKIDERENPSFNPKQDYDLKLRVNFPRSPSRGHHH